MRILVLSLIACGFLASEISVAQTLVDIPGGTFVMGDPKGDVNEAPKTVSVAPFRLMRLEVTNDQFIAFSK
jgi:formylglycine-generating enzyme required for sulfatase activity